MKALSLIQPWSSIIAIGEKQWETRSWSTPYRGPIAIHASGNRDEVKAGVLRHFHQEAIGLVLEAGTLPFKAIVALAMLTDCQPTEQLIGRISPREAAVGDFGPGRFGFRLDMVLRLREPVDAGGMLGIWEVPPGVAKKVLGQLRPEVAATYVGLAGAYQ